MIVDTHVYCFRAPDHPAGHATSADHLKFWQWGYAGHHNPSYSTRDRQPGNSSLLMDPAPGDPWRIADRNFRVDHDANRMLWTVDGEDFTKHYLPPQTVEWSAAACIGEMDYAGRRLGAQPRRPGARPRQRVLRRVRPRVPGPAQVDGDRGRAAHPDRSGSGVRGRPPRDRGPRPPRPQDHPRVRLPDRRVEILRRAVVAAVLGYGDAARRADLLLARRRRTAREVRAGLHRRAVDSPRAGPSAIPTRRSASRTGSRGGRSSRATGSR